MTEKRTVEITDRDHLITLGCTIGLLTAIEAIKDLQQEHKGQGVSGLYMARLAVAAQEAEMRVRLMQDSFRLAYATFGSLEGYSCKTTGDGVITLEPEASDPNAGEQHG